MQTRKVELPRGAITISGTSEYSERINIDGLRHIITLCERVLDAGSVVLDVGANIGVTSIIFSQYCKDGSVYAAEPHPSTFRQLEHNLLENGVYGGRPVKAFNVALGERSGEVLFRDEERYNTGNAIIPHFPSNWAISSQQWPVTCYISAC